MKRLAMVLLVAVAALASVGVALFLRTGRGGAPEAAGPHAVAPGPAAPGDLALPQAPADEPPDDARSAAGEPQPAEGKRVAAPAGDGAERAVLVVNGLSGEPVGGASLYLPVVPDKDVERARESFELLRADLTAYLARFATRSRADASGHGTVPGDRSGFVYGFAPGLCGRAYARAGQDGPLRLALYADDEIRVRVVDAAGAPVAGAPVSLMERRDQGRSVRVLLTEESDAKGEARLEHIGVFARDGSYSDPSGHYVVGLHVPSPTPIEVDLPAELDPLRLPAEAGAEDGEPPERPWITLRAPASGSVVVHVVDEEGTPEHVYASVYLASLDPQEAERARAEGPDAPRLLGGAAWWSSPQVTAIDGDARFPFVPIGLTLGVVSRAGDSHDQSTLVVEGPRVAGEEQEVTIGPGPRSFRILARLQDEEGRPLAGREIDFELKTEQGSMSSRSRVNAESTFRVKVSRIMATGGIQSLDLRVLPRRDGADAPAAADDGCSYHADALPELVPGDNDLGVLTLTRPPLLVSGRVVDRAGAPVPDVQVELGCLVRTTGDDGAPSYFRVYGDTTRKTDAEGRFRFVGAPNRPPMGDIESCEQALKVTGLTVAPSGPWPFRPGAKDLVVTVESGGWIEGTALVSDLRLLGAVRVQARRSGSDERGEAPVRWKDATFRVAGLDAGSWDVSFQVDGDPEPVAVVHGVRVPSGGAAEDGRLRPVDLRALQRIRVRVEAESGVLPWNVRFLRRNPGAPDWMPLGGGFRPPGQSTEIDFLTAFPGFDLRVTAPGFRSAELQDVDGDRSIVLRQGFPVVVAIVGAPLAGTGEDTALQLSLWSSAGKAPGESVEVERGTGEVTLRAPEPGEYRVRTALVVRSSQFRTFGSDLEEGSLGPVEVRDGTPPARLVLDLDPELVRTRYQEILAAHVEDGR